MPEATRQVLERLAVRFALVACLSGRSGSDAARIVGLDGIRYVGNHGLELHPNADGSREKLGAFRAFAEERWPVEDKGLSLTLHFREAPDEKAARASLEAIAEEARSRRLRPRWGRKVLEIRPDIDADKGTAVAALLAEAGTRHAMYAGDDTTDIDAFAALAEARLDTAVCIAVDSPEAPAELLAASDAVARNTDELAAALRRLSES